MIGHLVRPGREALHLVGPARRPRVVEGQRGPVVDQLQRAVPQQHVGVAPRPVGVGDQRVEPHDPPGELRIHGRHRPHVQGPGQEVDAQVHPDREPEQVLDLLVRLRRRQLLRHDDRAPTGGRAARCAPAISAQITSATSARGPWPAPRNLTTYMPEVVGLHQAGQGPALAQGGHVPRRPHRSSSAQPRTPDNLGGSCRKRSNNLPGSPGARCLRWPDAPRRRSRRGGQPAAASAD